MYLANHFSEVLKNENSGANIFNNINMATTIKILLMLLKMFKV
jgi:hypothetical protein